MAIADYLRKLVELKNQLVANLKSMGVAADESEKFNTLVPKVLECKQNMEAEFDTSTGAITSMHIDIPNSVEAIGDSAYQNAIYITSVSIPDSVTSIGDYAFNSCTSLASITIPDSVTSIGRFAFNNCTSLASITIPDSVTSIEYRTFISCTSLESITIPDSVTSIGDYAFYKCSNLANIYYTGTQEQWNAITKSSGWNTNMGSNVSGGTTIHYNYVPE